MLNFEIVANYTVANDNLLDNRQRIIRYISTIYSIKCNVRNIHLPTSSSFSTVDYEPVCSLHGLFNHLISCLKSIFRCCNFVTVFSHDIKLNKVFRCYCLFLCWIDIVVAFLALHM